MRYAGLLIGANLILEQSRGWSGTVITRGSVPSWMDDRSREAQSEG